MRKFIQLALILGLCANVFAQTLHISENTYEKVAVSFHSDTLSVEEVSANGSLFSRISMPDYDASNNPGAPQLPLFSKLLQIPVCDSVVVTIVNAEYIEYAAADLGITHPLYPAQPSFSKSATQPPFSYDPTVYATDTFYALPLVSVEKAGIRRDIALANVYFSPVQYNPVTQRVRLYTRVDAEFTFANTDMATTNSLRKYASPMFTLDSSLVINKMKSTAKNEFQGVPIKYLIIANSTFSSNTDLEAFVEWKRRLGYLVEVAYTSNSSVGTTTTSIKSFIQNKYDNATTSDPAPTFLLLIGDVAQIPAFASTVDPGGSETHYTDLYYSTLTGNDNIPDCYCGRLSATNATQLKNQLDKITMYEQYTMPDPSYLGKAILIAGTDDNWSQTHADGQINYAYNNYVNPNSTTHNYTTVYKHNYNCSSQAATIRNEVSAGAGWVNYTAHGSETGWYDPSFQTSHVSSLTNTNKYGLLIGNCCLTGSFQQSECFAEAVMRAQNKGAMGYIGASKETYWDQDVYWAVGVRSNITANMSYSSSNLGMYDKLFHTHNEAQSVWVSTIGGILQGGNLSVQSSSSSSTYKQYYWEIYHCFGDPSVRVYLGIPNTMTVTADETIPLSSGTYTVQVPAYAYVALKKNTTEYVVAGFANASGDLTLTLPSSIETGTYELVVLAQNYIPYFQTVEIADDGSCAAPTNVSVTDITPYTASLSWTGDGSQYNIEIQTGSEGWTSVATHVTAATYSLTSLQDNTAYQVRVQAVCDDETSYWKNVSFSTPIACPVPTDLHCITMNTTAAMLGWTENGSADNWILQYGTQSSFATGTYTQVTVTSNPVTLTGLTTGTTYYARIRANCGSVYGQSSWSDVCSFTPASTQTVEIGSGTGTSNYLPTNNYYRYSLTQQIYTVAELGEAGDIVSVDFYKNSTTSCNRNLDIYMVSTSKSSFDSGSDWITVTSSDKVFSGTVNFSNNAWTTIQLNTPFAYDGVHNVAIIVDDNTNSRVSNTPFLSFSASSQAIYISSNNTNYNPASPPSSGTAASSKNQIRVTKEMGSCPTPVDVAVSDVSGISAQVSWNGVADSYTVRYRPAAEETTYFSDDFENGIDNWTVIRSSGGTESTDWRLFNGSFSSSSIEPHSGSYMLIGRSWASDAYTVDNWLISPAVTLNGTLSFWVRDDGTYHEHYDVYVSTGSNAISDFTLVHSPGDASAEWTEVTVDLSSYHGVTGYVALRLTDSDQDYLLVDDFSIYGQASSPSEWQSTVSSSATAAITGLLPLTNYEVQVQSNCGDSEESDWSDAVTFTTGEGSLIPSYVHINGESSVCQGNTTTLTASSDVPVSYYWNTGATTASITVPAGDYTVTVTSATNHSLVSDVFTVTEKQNQQMAVYETVCESELPYVWNGSNYTEGGPYQQTLTAANGCDSVVTLHLTVDHTSYGDTSVVECESFVWYGETLTESAVRTQTITNTAGCDSVVTLHLTINHGTHGAETVSACESYLWYGETLTESTDRTRTYNNEAGCPSTDTLHLTINNPVHTAITVTECGSYTWTDGDGATYTTSGDHTYSHEDAHGCTQVDTLHLTINNPAHTAITVTECGSYTWTDGDGATYTTSGDHTYSHKDANGCTQVDTLHLTIHNPVHTAITVTECGSYTWSDGDGATYTTSGDHTYSHKDANVLRAKP